jgi:hypothetical protein
MGASWLELGYGRVNSYRTQFGLTQRTTDGQTAPVQSNVVSCNLPSMYVLGYGAALALAATEFE